MMLQSGVSVGEIARRLSFYDLSHGRLESIQV